MAYENLRAGFRANLRGTLYSKWIVSRAASGAETRAPGFTLWDVYAAKRIGKGFEAFGTVDNLFNNQDPNTGKFNAQNIPLPINRPEVGRTFRIGLNWSWARESK